VKLILIGGSGVGKSSLLMQFSENTFSDNYLTTIGVDFRYVIAHIDSRVSSKTARTSNSRYGIPLDRSDSEPLPHPTTRAQMGS
jgi:GTPase SAR1 family protein